MDPFSARSLEPPRNIGSSSRTTLPVSATLPESRVGGISGFPPLSTERVMRRSMVQGSAYYHSPLHRFVCTTSRKGSITMSAMQSNPSSKTSGMPKPTSDSFSSFNHIFCLIPLPARDPVTTHDPDAHTRSNNNASTLDRRTHPSILASAQPRRRPRQPGLGPAQTQT
jgi:hypothetical protein